MVKLYADTCFGYLTYWFATIMSATEMTNIGQTTLSFLQCIDTTEIIIMRQVVHVQTHQFVIHQLACLIYW